MRTLLALLVLMSSPALSCDGPFVEFGIGDHFGGEDVYREDDQPPSDIIGRFSLGYQRWNPEYRHAFTIRARHESDPLVDDKGEEILDFNIRLFFGD